MSDNVTILELMRGLLGLNSEDLLTSSQLQQEFFEAVKKTKELGPNVLEAFINQNYAAFDAGEINVNALFIERESWQLTEKMTDNSKTVLTWVVQNLPEKSVLSIFSLLSERGADINSKDNDGNTIVHRLVDLDKNYNEESIPEENTISWFKLCKGCGASITEKNNAGQTPQDIAKLKNRTMLAEALRKMASSHTFSLRLG